MAGNSLRRLPLRRPSPVESEFDPFELIGTLIPFVDPFGYDERDFRADIFSPTLSLHAASSSDPDSATQLHVSNQSSSPTPALQPSPSRNAAIEQRGIELAAVALDTDQQLPKTECQRT